eukprot:8562379-Alexandrium_andersonii.AAC.1
MSASLVGSEMCIRDSSSDRFMGSRCPEAMGSEVVRPPLLGPSGSNSEPVSYTHLTLPTICSV